MALGRRAVQAWASRGLGWIEQGLGLARDRCADGVRVARFLRASLQFEPRPDDVYVATYPRSGTTWMQFLVYLLLSSRRLDFDHLSQVSPWFERSLALGTRSTEDFRRMASPRIFKSHLRPEWVPRPGRVIYVEREGPDVLVSYYHFYRSHLRFEGTFDEFFERFMTGALQYRSWFDHVAAWQAAAETRSVLWVRYEDLRRDPAAVVEAVAEYLRRPLASGERDAIVQMTSYESMKARESQFDPITEHLIDQRLLGGHFIRSGEAGRGKDRLTPRQIERFETRQSRTVAKLGLEPRLADFLH